MIRTTFCLGLLWLAESALAQRRSDEPKPSKRLAIPSAQAWDLALSTGAGFGSYSSKSTESKNYGGIVLAGDWINDSLFELGTASLRASLLLDFQNSQIVKKGLSLGQSIYLWGGKKREVHRLKFGTIASSDRHSVSLALRLSQNFFSASPSTEGAKQLDGTTLNLESGLVYAWNADNGLSLGCELGLTVLSLSNSVERAKESTTELLFSARRYL